MTEFEISVLKPKFRGLMVVELVLLDPFGGLKMEEFFGDRAVWTTSQS